MHSLVASVGETPAVVTECIDELAREGIGIGRVVMLYTRHTLPHYIALKIDFTQGVYKGRIAYRGIELPFDDIHDSRESIIFRSMIYKVLREEGQKASSVHLLIAGGRKSMVADATLAALAARLDYVYHVILPRGQGVLDSEPLLSSYNMLNYINSDAPQDLVDKIVEICHPLIKGKALIKIPLPRLNDDAVNSIVKSMLV
ncbi:MAG: CRISPR-associated ring nuclease [Candidatus Nitrosocaldus sp.]|nr:CRISPR-associated ring nuclease [Candidatus Nitrosocaldus sp.]